MRTTIDQIKRLKCSSEKIAMLTAYDYPTARIVDDAGVPMILVGDSLGMVVLGYDSTVPVTMADMLHHTKAVVRGSSQALVIADMPFMSYQISPDEAVRNAGRLMQEGGCQAVKLEGGERVVETIKRIVGTGIPVVGHLGLTPQSVNQLSGFRVQGKTPKAAVQLINDAKSLEKAGAFCVVLESIPAYVAEAITERIEVPTIGIGAGPDCDGQVQVIHDIIGLFDDFVPKHTRRYATVGDIISNAVRRYAKDVKKGSFPTSRESYGAKRLPKRETTAVL